MPAEGAERSVKHFLNSAMLAPNVMTVPVDPGIVDALAPLAVSPDPAQYASHHPGWNSDIRWISPRTEAGFAPFDAAFATLGIADHVRPYLDLEREVRLYAGFFVVRSRCEAPDFHRDWIDTGNEAFTLLTPIGAAPGGFGLLYRTLTGEIAEYDYCPGEAILFGDNFVHSTRPGQSSDPVALLCFNFGTDKIEHWPRIRTTAAYQGELVRRPDGTYERRATVA
ncbi:MAG: hypothetical protein ABIR51_03030 [Sphingomicrobium sp.]